MVSEMAATRAVFGQTRVREQPERAGHRASAVSSRLAKLRDGRSYMPDLSGGLSQPGEAVINGETHDGPIDDAGDEIGAGKHDDRHPHHRKIELASGSSDGIFNTKLTRLPAITRKPLETLAPRRGFEPLFPA